MSRHSILTVLVLIVATGRTEPVAAGGETGWVSFQDQTATRIDTSQDPNSGPGVVVSNTDEKDYAWGDLDNDGDTDLVAVYKQLGTTTGKRRNVLLMNENGVLVDRTTQYVTASAVTLASGGPSQGFLDLTNDRDVAIVDLTGDGWPEVVTATTLSGGEGGTIGDKAISHPRIYINLGDDPPGSGIWQGLVFDDVDRAPTMPAEPRFTSVAAGDVDNDDDVDLYFTDQQQGGPRPVDLNDRLWINDGTGYFADETAARLAFDMVDTSFAAASAIADFNQDGARDIMKAAHIGVPPGVYIHYNNPVDPGFFSEVEYPYVLSPTNANIGELNNDGSPDLIISDHGTDRYQINLGPGEDGLAVFSAALPLQGAGSSEFSGNDLAADLDKDGFEDVLIASVDMDLINCTLFAKVYRNLADPPLVTLALQGNAGIAPSHLQGVHDFAVFDIDGDTWLDLVIGRCSGTTVYMNLALVPCTGFGDMNADGDLDGRDIPGFVQCYISQAPACNCADVNDDQAITDFDLQRFVFELLAAP